MNVIDTKIEQEEEYIERKERESVRERERREGY